MSTARTPPPVITVESSPDDDSSSSSASTLPVTSRQPPRSAWLQPPSLARWRQMAQSWLSDPPFPLNCFLTLLDLSRRLVLFLTRTYGGSSAPEGAVVKVGPGKFRRAAQPPISLPDYLERIVNYVEGLEPLAMLAVVVYAGRVHPTEGQVVSLWLDSHSLHRFILAALCLASKALGDHYYSNFYYGKVGGVSTSELNNLELGLAMALDWRLQCTTEEIGRAYSSLAAIDL